MREQVDALRRSAGVARRPEIKTLAMTGPDRVRFLNGMVTNDVSQLAAGQGVMAIKTSAKGRVEGVMRVRAGRDVLFLDLRAVSADLVRGQLEKLIIMDDCAVGDVSDKREVLSVLGPAAHSVVEASGLRPLDPALPDDSFVRIGEVDVIRDRTLGVAGYELHVPTLALPQLFDRMLAAGAIAISDQALDVVRVEAGVPIDGRDLDDEVIPMEARLEPMISFKKGCYIGQEVIARGTIQGHVNHFLVGLRFGDAAPEEGAELHLSAEDVKKVGEVTSVVRSPELGYIGLGYVRRGQDAPGTKLVAKKAGSETPYLAEVSKLPFVTAP